MSNNVLAAEKKKKRERINTPIHYTNYSKVSSNCICRLKSGFQNAHGTTVVPAGVNRLLRCGRCAYRFRDVVDSRVSPNERDIARLALWDAGDSSLLRAHPAFIHAPRCDSVGGIVVVDQQAHTARSGGFRRGSTWRVIHRVAGGITLARWLQLVVAGPRGPTCRPSFSLVYAILPFPLSSSLSRVEFRYSWSSCV